MTFRAEIEERLSLEVELNVVAVGFVAPYVVVRSGWSSGRDARYLAARVWVAVQPDSDDLEDLSDLAWSALYSSSFALPQARTFEPRSLTPGSPLTVDVVRFDVRRA